MSLRSISQMGKSRDIDPVVGKALGVLGHAEVFKPIRNLLHCGEPSHVPLGRTYPMEGL
jgi:hypothetical protein